MKLLFLLLAGLTLNAGQFDSRMREAGLVDVATVAPDVVVRLAYATTDNFTGVNMYGELRRAYLRPEVAQMVAAAQKKLQAARAGHSLLILDAARPFSVQKYMYSLVAGTPQRRYVANPANGGGKHNYGAAVDVTIIDSQGVQLDMGSPFDSFIEASHTGSESDLVARGVITRAQADNRALLTNIMKSVGFHQDPNEWWHFDRYTMAQLRAGYKRLDF
ncbi:MAG: M15 family metallopeptidase [Rikenellaceae bacterium]|jgi:D-alanyl-D-alanine dipeptidase|nr:M15 family metallopeptidase [Rikenellaceae bacterium]